MIVGTILHKYIGARRRLHTRLTTHGSCCIATDSLRCPLSRYSRRSMRMAAVNRRRSPLSLMTRTMVQSVIPRWIDQVACGCALPSVTARNPSIHRNDRTRCRSDIRPGKFVKVPRIQIEICANRKESTCSGWLPPWQVIQRRRKSVPRCP